ncbi:deoxyhypusine synthase [Candidatus Pacearchaeota archaeon]|nr:deoxyhypusine synthase [Candidatus Pacearchaeota archaeon]
MENDISEKEKLARKSIFKKSEEISGKEIRGYDFNLGIDYEKILDSYSTTGMQATKFAKAIDIINKMVSENVTIYLGYTSSMVSSGLREIFRYLAEKNKVNVIVSTVGGIEEDIIKCLGSFIQGKFTAKGSELREKGINRIGNIFVPNSRYCDFEDFVIPVLEECLEIQKKQGRAITPSELIWKLGERINNPESIYYWCWKNKIQVFCPAITDGSLGDMIYFFKSKHPEFQIDVAEDMWRLNNTTLGQEKTGMIILGAGVIKHHICNANLFRNGADYSVYINNSYEYDGSDAGALPEEAISWGKVQPDAEHVKVHGDVILLFPLIVAKTFAKEK